jgi:sulfur relay (sulfurtransferase) DsrC/TusE family protein
MENLIKLTCKRSERTIGLIDWNEVITVNGYEVYNGDKPICFISKCDSLGEWTANSFYKFENCEGLASGITKKELLENIERLLQEGTFYLTWNERNYINDSKDYTKEVAELEAKEVSEKLTQSQLEAINHVWKSFDKYKENNQEVISLENTWVEDDEVAELEVSEKETKSDKALKLFRELDDDGLVDTKHYDEALCQKQNVQYHWDEDLSIGDIDTVIEYFKNLKQLIALERKVNKLAIYG